MKTMRFCAVVGLLLAGVLTLGAQGEAASKPKMAAPSIEGTYMLMSRALKDGTMMKPPQIVGMLTYTKTYRNFNVCWKDANGKAFSLSLVSTYTLTATEYTETVLLSIMNDQIGGKEIAYDMAGATKSAPVTDVKGHITFKLPFDPVTATIGGGTMTAVNPDFTDTWQRVK